MKKRKDSKFIKQLDPKLGHVKGMINIENIIYIATDIGIFYLSPKKRLIRCKLEEDA